MAEERRFEVGRRGFLGAAGSLAAAPLLGSMISQASAQTAGSGASAVAQTSGRRKLGALEVSSVGIGVQNMSRTYQTTIPSRPEMIKIIRTAFDRGVTFFDAAEAYGPHEVERILGEGVAPFRDKAVITSKFGFDIDLETGVRRPGGRNSRPGHIRLAVEGMLIQQFYEQHAVPASSFANMVAFAISQPEDVDVNEILFRPTSQQL